MSKNTIKIRGDLLKKRLEITTGKTLYELSEENGFSRNFLSEACRSGRASPIVQSVVKKYGIDIRSVIFSDVKKEFEQMSIEDLQTEKATRAVEESRKAFVKLGEAVNKAGEEIRASFIRFTEEWNKAIEEYNKRIGKIKEIK